ncbi:MAG: sugar phosphate isomerase/epimerase [Pirellulales bacterium]|nr:sugar phosphate isomerase/epimerase [Pirellulales bacterium]
MNRSITRRKMLVRSAQAAAAVLGTQRFAPLYAARESRGFKIGACDWSLQKQCDPAAFDVAKRIGLDGVQVSLGTVKNDMHLRRPDVQKKYKEAAARSGLEIASLAIGEMNRVPLKSDPRAARWLDESIDVCKALGLTVSMPAFFGKGELDMGKTTEIDHLVEVLKHAAHKAEKQGVVIALENYLNAEDNMRLIERVGSPAVKVYYDVGNSHFKGYDIHKEIRRLGKLIGEFHFKDGAHRIGHGRIDFRKVRESLDAIDYRGWIVLESAAPSGVVPDYAAQCEYLRVLFPRTV